MSCLCGDIQCYSCGPAQGNYRCIVCGTWADEGCECTIEEIAEAQRRADMEFMEGLFGDIDND